jgi:hypothetical protein
MLAEINVQSKDSTLYFGVKKSVPLTANISPEARDLLYREVREFSRQGQRRIPLGKFLSALILYSRDMGDWEEIADDVKEELNREIDERRKRDRERKRK